MTSTSVSSSPVAAVAVPASSLEPRRQPLVSVVMPNFNDAATIGDALAAMLGQSYRQLEIIVVDDRSTDHSVDVVERFQRADPRVRLIRLERNSGPIVAQLAAFEHTQGEYVMSQSANDTALPGFLEKVVGCLERHPGVAVGFCDLTCPAEPWRGEVAALSSHPTSLTPDEVVAVLEKGQAFMLGCATAVVRRSAWRDAGWLRPDLRWMADFFALYVMAFRHGLCHVPEPLYAVRPPGYSLTGPTSSVQRAATVSLLKYLDTAEYRDVAAAFRRSGVLAAVPGILSTALPHPSLWKHLAPVTIRRLVLDRVKTVVSPLVSPSVRRSYRAVRDRRAQRHVESVQRGRRR